jgi:protein-S-isoprenylcysteine O-methyltransferase Ste14
MDINAIFRVAMVLEFVGYHIPRTYYRRQARKTRIEEGTGESELSESKWRLLLMAISGLGANLVGLIWIINPDWLAWFNLDLPLWLRWVGIVVGVVAVIMGYFVHRTLGLSFTPTLQTTQGHRLVTQGIYAHIRHPMYTTFFLLFVSSFLMTTNWLIAILSFVYSLLLFNRVRAEERMMVATFGDEYRNYMRQTGRFLPRLTHS